MSARSEKDEALIRKITSHEADLMRIYEKVFFALAKVNRADLGKDQVASLRTLKFPNAIEPSEAAAVLKAILGSTDNDKFELEDLSKVRWPDGKSLGEFVREKLLEIDIGYHDFWPYLRERGWMKET